MEHESRFAQLEGKFETEGERKSKFSVWVYSSSRSLTIRVVTKLKSKNEISYKSNDTLVKVEHEGTMKKQIEISMASKGTVAQFSVESKYPRS